MRLQIMYYLKYIYKEDLALNNQHALICHKIQLNQTNLQIGVFARETGRLQILEPQFRVDLEVIRMKGHPTLFRNLDVV